MHASNGSPTGVPINHDHTLTMGYILQLLKVKNRLIISGVSTLLNQTALRISWGPHILMFFLCVLYRGLRRDYMDIIPMLYNS